MPNVPQANNQGVAIVKTVNYVLFGLSSIENLQGGEKAINFIIPDGTLIRFQLSQHGVRELVKGLTGGIEIPAQNGMG